MPTTTFQISHLTLCFIQTTTLVKFRHRRKTFYRKIKILHFKAILLLTQKEISRDWTWSHRNVTMSS